MGALADLINMPLEDLKYKHLGKEFEPKEGKKTIDTGKERQDVIDKYVQRPENVDLWLSTDITFTFQGRKITIPAGKYNANPRLAVFLIGKYGVNNQYGNFAKQRNEWVHDEPVFEVNKQKFDFTTKAKAKKDE